MPCNKGIDVDVAWTALLGLRDGKNDKTITFNGLGAWSAVGPVTAKAQDLLNLYAPFLLKKPTVTGHLGQSMDGFIATQNGLSHYITGPENIVHLHRMRALADAILVGNKTVLNDDPQLTTRLITGPNPTRIVIDPTLRLSSKHRVFRNSEAATLILCGEDACQKPRRLSEHVEILPIPLHMGELDPKMCVHALTSRGLDRLFIEGGGQTVSKFVNAKVVHRLHITIAPIFLGAGRTGLQVHPTTNPNSAFQHDYQRYSMGDDMLFDYKLI